MQDHHHLLFLQSTKENNQATCTENHITKDCGLWSPVLANPSIEFASFLFATHVGAAWISKGYLLCLAALWETSGSLLDSLEFYLDSILLDSCSSYL